MHLVVQYHHSENTTTGYDNSKKKAYHSISNDVPCAIRTVDGWHCSCYKKSTISRSRLMAPHSRVGYSKRSGQLFKHSAILPRTYQDCYADAIFDMTVDSKRVCAWVPVLVRRRWDPKTEGRYEAPSHPRRFSSLLGLLADPTPALRRSHRSVRNAEHLQPVRHELRLPLRARHGRQQGSATPRPHPPLAAVRPTISYSRE